MDRTEKRRDPRVPLVLRVDYRGSLELIRDTTENLSAGGLFIRTDRDLAEGERIPLLVSFPGLLESLEIEVEVVRKRQAAPQEPRGVAVRIPPDRHGDRRKLARLASSVGADAAPARHTFQILVVEDNRHVVTMYDYALRRMRTGEERVDVAISFADNGHAALARMREPPLIDLVMADLYMPVMDGFTLLERIRADPDLRQTPVLVISAGGAEARARAIELGVDVYLQKPVQFADIIETVRALLRIGS